MSLGDFLIRAAAEADAAAIADIYGPYVQETAISFEAEPPGPTVMAQRIAKTTETHPWLVAECDGEIVGYAYAGKYHERAAYRWTIEVTVYVGRAWRGKSVGRSLYLPLLNLLRRQRFRTAIAAIALPNPESVGLHQAFGFKPAGIIEESGYKFGRWHSVGYWRLGLADNQDPPAEPICFADFRRSAAFAGILSS